MKQLLLAGLLSFGLLSTAQADTVKVLGNDLIEGTTTIQLKDGIGGGNGGEFDVYLPPNVYVPPPGPTSPSWSGFCLERNEYFTDGNTYRIDSITDGAINGGIGGPNPDPISSETAWLFYKFWIHDLKAIDGLNDYYDNVNSSINREKNATALQDAIWAFEEEITAPLAGTNYYYDLAVAESLAPNDIGQVRVLNLVSLSGGVAQDQLVVIDSPSLGVPEPSSFAGLLGIVSVSLLGCVWRRKRQQAV
jgi:hypothetical protein